MQSKLGIDYETLVLSAGGIKGYSFLGSLMYIDKYISEIINIKKFIGTSVGSFISYLLLIGYTPMEIHENMSKYEEKLCNALWGKKADTIDFNNEESLLDSIVDINSIVSLITKFGFASLDTFKDVIKELTVKKLGYLYEKITCIELFNLTQKHYIAVTYNVSDSKCEYIDHTTNPDIPLYQLIAMSCCVPIVFEACIYNDKYYIDGGVFDQFPIEYASSISVGNILAVGFEFPTDNTKPAESSVDVANKIKEKYNKLKLVPKEKLNPFQQFAQSVSSEILPLFTNIGSENNNIVGFVKSLVWIPYHLMTLRNNTENIKRAKIDIVYIKLTYKSPPFGLPKNIDIFSKSIIVSDGYNSTKIYMRKRYKLDANDSLIKKIKTD